MDRQTKEVFLVANGWTELNGKWFNYGISVVNLDVDTAYMIQTNNVDDDRKNEYHV